MIRARTVTLKATIARKHGRAAAAAAVTHGKLKQRTIAGSVEVLPPEAQTTITLADAIDYLRTKRDWMDEIIRDFERFSNPALRQRK